MYVGRVYVTARSDNVLLAFDAGRLISDPVVLTSMLGGASRGPPFQTAWRQLQSEIFQSTTHGMHIVTSRSGHLIQQDEPDLVVNAIRWVWGAARKK